jgi:hypothetical protein
MNLFTFLTEELPESKMNFSKRSVEKLDGFYVAREDKFDKCINEVKEDIFETKSKKNEMPPMSEEQKIIFNCIQSGDNAIGDACAGSGKSTTILSIAKNLQNKRFVQLTYNSMLCNDIKEKIEKYNLDNLNVYTYHSLVVKFYDSTGYTDTVIRRVILHNTEPKIKIRKFDVLVLDETQDMTLLYFRLVLKFCRDMGEQIQLLILGDYMQGLYEFKGADVRFLTKAQDIWSSYEGLSSKTFHHCYLKMSYRVTNQMAEFVNKVMLGEERLLACKEGEPVVYIRQPTHFAEKYIIYKINLLISEYDASPSDFFILGASIKGNNSEIRKIENALVENNIPCYVPLSEDDKIDERVIDGKVVFSTFHSVKGRQRKYVFVTGFNHSYFYFYAKKLSIDVCPNTLYVACTRATEGLYIVEHNNRRYDRPPKFLKMNHLELKNKSYVEFKGMHQTIFEEVDDISLNDPQVLTIKRTSPAELIKFLPEPIFDKINYILEKIFIPFHFIFSSKQSEDEKEFAVAGEGKSNPMFSSNEEHKKIIPIEIPNIIKTKDGFYEDVSNINGIALPIMYFDSFCKNEKENHMNEKMKKEGFETKGRKIDVLQDLIEEHMKNTKQNHHLYLKKEMELLRKEVSFNENDFFEIKSSLPSQAMEKSSKNFDFHKISNYLKTSNLYYSVKEKLYFKMKQIKNDEYNWFSKEIVEQCFQQMNKVLYHEVCDEENGYTFKGNVEYTFLDANDDVKHTKIDNFLKEYFPNIQFRFNARADLVTNDSVWEIKCVNSITHEHLLQLVIYCWLWRMTIEDIENFENIVNFQIFNIKTGEHYLLNATMEELNEVILIILRGKYTDILYENDEMFIENCRKCFFNGFCMPSP